jgi:cardiolipin synthase A/B
VTNGRECTQEHGRCVSTHTAALACPFLTPPTAVGPAQRLRLVGSPFAPSVHREACPVNYHPAAGRPYRDWLAPWRARFDGLRKRPKAVADYKRSWKRHGTAIIVTAGRWTLRGIIVVLAIIGFLHLTRGTAVRHVRGVGVDRRPIAVSDPHFPLNVTMLTGAWLVPGNRVEVALNGDGTYPRLWDDLRSARDSITLQVYYGAPGRMADTIFKILLDRARAGVRVFLLYDAFGTVDMPANHREPLRAAGVRIEAFRPIRLSTLHLAQNRSHARGVVIDGRIGWTGGFGIDDKWLGDGRTNGSWRDTNVRFEGPAVRQLQAAFAAAWVEATGVLATGPATLSVYDDGVEAAGLLHTSPTLGSTPAERFFALSIAAARKTLYLTNAYFAPDHNFVELLTAAAQRGVDVRVLTAGARTDVNVVRLAGRASYQRLLAAGVRLYEWQPSTLHAKTFVIDGEWSTIGSMNFDNRSMALNDEATLMVRDRTIGQQMNQIFLDDLRRSEQITAAGFRGRAWSQRMAEWAANLLTRLL